MLVFCALVSIVGGIGTYLENEAHLPPIPRLVQSLSLAAMWLPFILLSAWLVLDYRRSRLLVGTKSLALRGVIRTKRIGLRDIVCAAWRRDRSLQLRTARGRLTIPVSQFLTLRQAMLIALLHERIGQAAEEGWDKIEPNLDAIRDSVDPRHNNQCFLRLSRVLLLGPILGLLAGTGLHFILGHQAELGWRGNLFLLSSVGGCGASLALLVMGSWLWWMENPEPLDSIAQDEFSRCRLLSDRKRTRSSRAT